MDMAAWSSREYCVSSVQYTGVWPWMRSSLSAASTATALTCDVYCCLVWLGGHRGGGAAEANRAKDPGGNQEDLA